MVYCSLTHSSVDWHTAKPRRHIAVSSEAFAARMFGSARRKSIVVGKAQTGNKSAAAWLGVLSSIGGRMAGNFSFLLQHFVAAMFGNAPDR